MTHTHEITFRGVTIEQVQKKDYVRTGEQSSAFRKLWKALKMPQASFRSDSYSMGDSLTVDLKEKFENEEQKKVAQHLEAFFQSGKFNSYEDIYEYDSERHVFTFKYVFINEPRD